MLKRYFSFFFFVVLYIHKQQRRNRGKQKKRSVQLASHLIWCKSTWGFQAALVSKWTLKTTSGMS